MRPNDWARLGTFLAEAWRESGPAPLGFAGAKDESVNEITSEDFLKRRLSSPAVLMVVAEAERRIVGLVTLKKIGQREVEVVGVAALKGPDARETEARLLRKATEVARKRGMVSIFARTGQADDRAARFYKELGFLESGMTGGPETRRPQGKLFRSSLR